MEEDCNGGAVLIDWCACFNLTATAALSTQITSSLRRCRCCWGWERRRAHWALPWTAAMRTWCTWCSSACNARCRCSSSWPSWPRARPRVPSSLPTAHNRCVGDTTNFHRSWCMTEDLAVELGGLRECGQNLLLVCAPPASVKLYTPGLYYGIVICLQTTSALVLL